MHEYITVIFASDESEPLGIVEPLYGAGFSFRQDLLLLTNLTTASNDAIYNRLL